MVPLIIQTLTPLLHKDAKPYAIYLIYFYNDIIIIIILLHCS